MLIVADELAGGVGGQGGLAGAGQAEEHGGVAVLADVGRAVHGEHPLLGQDIVHHGEHGLLDLAGVLGAADHHQMGLVVHQDGGLGAGAVHLGNALEARGGNDGIILMEVLQLVRRGAAQQLMDEQILTGQLIDDAEALGILGVRPGEAVENENVLVLEIRRDLGIDGVEPGLVHGPVHLAPGDVVMDGGGIHNELVVGAAAGVLPGLDHQGSGVGQGALPPAQSVLHQLRRRQIAVHRPGVDDAQLFQSVCFHVSFLLKLFQFVPVVVIFAGPVRRPAGRPRAPGWWPSWRRSARRNGSYPPAPSIHSRNSSPAPPAHRPA